MNARTRQNCATIICWLIGFNAIAAAELSPKTATVAAVQPENTSAEHPNAIGQISQRLLDFFLRMRVERNVDISDNVLGTSVRGSVKTQGSLVPLFTPDDRRGSIQLQFTGDTAAPRMIGQNGPATIFSSTLTKVDARKSVILDDQGIHLMPTVANGTTQLSINDVVAKRRFIERIARRRADRSQAEAQAITSQRTRTRLQQEIDRDAATPLKQAQDYFIKGFRNPLIARDALPKILRFSTTSEHLRLIFKQCCHSPLAPPQVAPSINAQHDIVVAFHESAIESIYDVFFGGKTAVDRDVLKTVHLLTGEDPRPLRVHARTPAWSMTFADRQPLDLIFADGETTIALRLKSLQYGERQFDGAFTVAVRYQLEKTPSGPRLNRQGALQVNGEIADGSIGELGEATSILRKKFSAVFPSVLSFDGMAPPSGGIWDKVGQLQLAQLDAKDGWVVIGYRLRQAPVMLVKHEAMR